MFIETATHEIKLKSESPVYTKPFPVALKIKADAEKLLQELESEGIIGRVKAPSAPRFYTDKKTARLDWNLI